MILNNAGNKFCIYKGKPKTPSGSISVGISPNLQYSIDVGESGPLNWDIEVNGTLYPASIGGGEGSYLEEYLQTNKETLGITGERVIGNIPPTVNIRNITNTRKFVRLIPDALYTSNMNFIGNPSAKIDSEGVISVWLEANPEADFTSKCFYYNDSLNRSFINSKDFNYLNDSGLAVKTSVHFGYNVVPDLVLATDNEIKSYIESKLKDINSASIKYYKYDDSSLPVYKLFSINKLQINNVISNPNRIIKFDRGDNSFIDYSVKVGDNEYIGCSIFAGKLSSGANTSVLEFYIYSENDLVGQYVEIKEVCKNMSNDEIAYLSTDYQIIVELDNAMQEELWKNAQVSDGVNRTVTTRFIYGFDNP